MTVLEMGQPRAEFAFDGSGYTLPTFAFKAPPELSGGGPQRYPVVIIGAGLAGLTLACDLAQRGVAAVVIDEDDTVGVRGASSRGICYAQKSLEIFRRLGIYERIAAKGITWSVGRTLAGNEEVYSFDLRQQQTHNISEQPPFINIQQFYIEWFLKDRIDALGKTDLRWKSRVVACEQDNDAVQLRIQTPAGAYTLKTDWLVDCAGVHSAIRNAFGLPVNPAKGDDRWCISDVRFEHEPPIERWTWIEAPFNENRAVWQHLMADQVWRLDYQMAPDASMEDVSKQEVVEERLRRQFGPDVAFEVVWVGPYSYRSQCLENFRHGRVLFAGDCAHVMSPFGARGGNSAIQDADNLGWKLALVLAGKVRGGAVDNLIDSYDLERRAGAQQNIQITRRTSNFLSPATPAAKLFRNAVIGLAKEHAFARSLVNTGRMSSPNTYPASSLNIGDGAGKHLQNVALRVDGKAGDLVDFIASQEVACLVIASGKAISTVGRLADQMRQYPVGFASIDGAVSGIPALSGDPLKLAAQCRLDGFTVVRPDLYCAGAFDAAEAQLMADRLKAWFE